MSITLNDTIAALATPSGVGGIAVLRLSGPRAWEIARQVVPAPIAPASRGESDTANTAHFARIRDADGDLVDEVVVTFFREPRSYTGDDVAEISCHGGRYAAARILQMILASGARMARPGEFTERAFLNGKLDLAQAEAVAGLIHARTERAGRAAARQLAGGLSEKVRAMRSRILDLLALLELELDFSEEDVEFQTKAARSATLSDLSGEMRALADTFKRGRLMREGVRVAIVGAPNAGKSTLLNALAEEERAIVSEEPGTTRDVVEARIELAGQEIILQDTAGAREASGRIESEGVARTRRAIAHADLVLLLLDVCDPRWPTDDVLALLSGARTILVLTKIDLRPGTVAHTRDLPDGLAPSAACAVSALHKQGLEPLLHDVMRIVLGEEAGKDEIVVAEARHHDALIRTIESLDRAQQQIAEPTLMASDLRDAVNALGEITGETVGEEILERIFSKFCIGK